MKTKIWWKLGVLVCVLSTCITAYLFWFIETDQGKKLMTNGLADVRMNILSGETNSNLQGSNLKTIENPGPEQKKPDDLVYQVFERIAVPGKEKEEVIANLNGLKNALLESDRKIVISRIKAFLDSGDDTPTGLSFIIGAGNQFREWPTFRVALLDFLSQIDPQEASSYVRKILEIHNSADEWAISLRIVAQTTPKIIGDDFLITKTAEMIRQESWLSNPTRGFLLAFDLIVATQCHQLIPDLDNYLQRKDSLSYASFVALDRLAVANPSAMARQLLDQPKRLSGFPQLRASLYARADVTDPIQRHLVESYLTKNNTRQEEIAAFAAIFPLYSQNLSHNLVTSEKIVPIEEQARRDLETLRVIEEWMQNQLPISQEILQKMHSRLKQFVASAKKGGYLHEN